MGLRFRIIVCVGEDEGFTDVDEAAYALSEASL